MTSTPPSNSGDDRARIYNGRYELIRQIARGGTAQVYLARDLLLDRPVALKVLFPELSSDPSFVERFRREAQAAANLSHPNIVPVFDWGESERTYFIVMEYVDGEPLSAVIRTEAPVESRRAAGVAADIAKALSYAHRHGVVHRDVKPGNVLLTRDGQVKVTDFGIARAVGTDDNVTQTGLVMGTATYFSPEQAQGLGVDGRSDVYALGVVLYEMVTGRPPFSADTPVAIAYKHVSERAVPPRELEPSLPETLEAVIMRAIEKQPGERYPTAEDLYSDLQRFSAGAPVLALAGAADVAATQALSRSGGAAATEAIVAAPTRAMRADPRPAVPAGAVTSGPPAAGTGGGEPQMPKRRWLGWSLVGVLLAGLLGLLVYEGGHALGYFGSDAYFHLTDVEQQPLATAAATLEKEGLVVHTSKVHNPASPGTVVSESPGPNRLVQSGDVVLLVASLGPHAVAVPGVLYQPYKKAAAALKSAGLHYQLVPEAPTQSGEQQGLVTRTDPAAGAQVKPGDVVKVYYVQGAFTKKIPSVANDSPAKATQVLYQAGFAVSGQTTAPSATVKAGNVIGTKPAVGTTKPAGTSVELVVSAGPPVSVPDVVGQKATDAESAILAAGLQYTIQYVPGLPSDAGYVASVSPNPTTQVAKGTTVTLDVVQQPTTTTTTTTTSTTSTSTTPTSTTPKKNGG